VRNEEYSALAIDDDGTDADGETAGKAPIEVQGPADGRLERTPHRVEIHG
jgi:hypothetical protein